MQPVRGLLDDDALRAVDHFVGHFFAAMGRQAVHEDRLLGRRGHQLGVDLIIGKIFSPASRFGLLAHAGPDVGVDGRRLAHRLGRIGGHGQLEIGHVTSSAARETPASKR